MPNVSLSRAKRFDHERREGREVMRSPVGGGEGSLRPFLSFAFHLLLASHNVCWTTCVGQCVHVCADHLQTVPRHTLCAHVDVCAPPARGEQSTAVRGAGTG